MSTDRRDAGFMLIEVLVATAVAAILLTMLIRVFGNTWSGVTRVREDAEAMLVGRAVLQAAAARGNLTIGEQRGATGRYAWTLSVSRPPPPNVPPGEAAPDDNVSQWSLYRVAIAINSPTGRRTTLETLRLGSKAP